VLEFLRLRKIHGEEEQRARDLFQALWIPDLFMKRVRDRADWTLFCPHEAPNLDNVFGDEFETRYAEYEAQGKGRETINA
jgi:ribonucleotide reductase alpha subunit